MLNFGFSMGRSSIACDGDVISNNPDFECDGYSWRTNESSHGYTGNVSYADSKATLVADGDNPDYYSLVPSNQALGPGNYRVRVVVSEISGTAKFSYKLNGTWAEAIDNITAPGEYEADMTISGGTTTDIQIGHKGASNGDSITFDYIGVEKVSNVVTHNNEPVTWQSEEVTYGN